MATQASEILSSSERPTHVRYWVIFFSVSLAVFSYIDRVALSRAASRIQGDLDLDNDQVGLILFAFVSCYALFEIPSGYLGDRLGPRSVLLRIVLWWSFFTFATGRAWNFSSLLICQALFGMGEAGCFPNITKALSIWLPQEEKVRTQGIIWLFARWGGAFTPLLVVMLLKVVSWRTAFALFGCIGIVWAAAFYWWFRDDPNDNPHLNAAERNLIASSRKLSSHAHKVPWGKLLSSRNAWLLCLQYFSLSFSWYFYITWLPTYMDKHLSIDITKSAILNGLPLFLGGLGSLACGQSSRYVAEKLGGIGRQRRVMSITGFVGASILLFVATRLHSAVPVMLAIGFSSFCNDLAMPPSWGAAMDMGGRYAGTLAGAMNMVGNLGGSLAALVTPRIVRLFDNNWNAPLYLAALVYLTGALLWVRLDPETPLDLGQNDPEPHHV
jgi:ACS family glucarate transporter-like MFS transporter